MAFERWLPVVGHEALYEVSDLGRVRRLAGVFRYQPTERVLINHIGYDGYVRVVLGKRQPLVHRLVMAAFVGPCPKGFEVDHVDDKRDNNDLLNLRYITVHENRSFPRKLSPGQVNEIKRLRIEGVPRAAVAKQFGVSEVWVSKIIKLKGSKNANS